MLFPSTDGKPGKAAPIAYPGLGRPGYSSCIRTGSRLAWAPVPGVLAHRGHERRRHTHRKRATGLLCPGARPVCLQVSAKRCAS